MDRREVLKTVRREPAEINEAGPDRRKFRIPLHAALLTSFAALAPHWSTAAPEPQAEPQVADTQSLETVVVTASALGVKKLDASYSIVAADPEMIKEANPKSTADLLKISPGIWPESTGGQTGANIEIAGFPGGGDAPYFTVQLNGSPLYGMPTLSFFEQSSAFRLDDTIERVEIVQGGPSVVFADGQPGATANFILKRGTEEPRGSLGVTWGDENLLRGDAFYGFKIADGWFGSVGGFYRTSDGVRDPQFKADKGGQFTATLSHDMDRGSIMFYARYLNDKNQFITPIPLIQHGTDSFSSYPGFDPLKDTYYSNAMRHVFLPSYPGGGTNADLANGRGADMSFGGMNLDLDFDNGWTLSDRLLVDGGDMDTNALFSGPNPASLNDLLFNLPSGQGGYQLPAGAVVTATYRGGGAVPLTQDAIQQGWWFIHKRLFNINNDLRVSKELFDGNTLTLGLYVAHYTMRDKWSLGNGMLMTNTPNARPIVVTYVDPVSGQTIQRTDNQGFVDFNGFHITERGKATNTALYLSDSWRINNWLLDASVRVENQDATNKVCNLTNQDLDSNPNTLFNNVVPVCNGTFSVTDYDPTRTSGTVGANYRLADNMSVYGRFSRGYHFLDFDNGIRGSTTGNTPPEQSIDNFEVGFKYQSPLWYADITAYYKEFTGLLYQPTNGLGTPVGSLLTYGSESKGVNAILAIMPLEGLRVQLAGNYLDGKYTDYDACIPYVNVVTGNGCARIQGQQLQRQPKHRFALTPSYRFPTPWGDVNTFVTYTYVGPHTQDQSGLQQLGTYHTLDFGVVGKFGDNWEARVQGTNVTNELGLTESNSRIFGPAAGAGGVILARPLEGREINFSVRYHF
ncbi:MAG: Vitamin B12 transporter BtuB [Steroidobacteraceae bacterium]|nr:Vitamin B12 transporter BtuB [Steroidobacteraceae bacterium]